MEESGFINFFFQHFIVTKLLQLTLLLWVLLVLLHNRFNNFSSKGVHFYVLQFHILGVFHKIFRVFWRLYKIEQQKRQFPGTDILLVALSACENWRCYIGSQYDKFWWYKEKTVSTTINGSPHKQTLLRNRYKEEKYFTFFLTQQKSCSSIKCVLRGKSCY